MKKIFVSYRREPDQYVAGNLSRELRRHFGESQVFRDKESIEGGVSWKQHVLDEIDRDSVLLVLIGQKWGETRDASGNRRLDKPDDPIRLEIADAMRDGAAIIPLLLENAQMPPASELPQELIRLAELNALKLRDGDWEADVAKIVQRLEKLGAKRVASADPLPVTTKRSAKAIWSFVIVALIAITLVGEDHDRETLRSFLILSLAALALAGFAYVDVRQRKVSGKGLAIGALVASTLTALMALGMLMEAPQQVAGIDSPAPASTPPSAAPPAQAPAPAPAQPSPQPAPASPPAVSTQALAPPAPPQPVPARRSTSSSAPVVFENLGFSVQANTPWVKVEPGQLNPAATVAFLRRNPEAYFIVIAEKLEPGVRFTNEMLTSVVKANLLSGEPTAKVLEEAPEILNGREGVRLVCEARVNGLDIVYRYWMHATTGNTYQLLVWGQKGSQAAVLAEAKKIFDGFDVLSQKK